MIGFFRKGERAVQLRTGLLKSHESVSSLFWPMRSGRDPCSVSIIGFGNVGLFIAYRYLKEGYSVCVYDLESDLTCVQQIMEAELPQMLNSFMFGKHLQHYSVAHIQAMLKKFSVAADLDSLVSKGSKVVFECIPEVLQRKQQLFADLTALLDQRGVAARDVLLCSCTQSLSIRSISMGAMTRYKSRLIGVSPSDQLFKFTIHCEQQRSIALIKRLPRGIPVVAFEETADGATRELMIADETPTGRLLKTFMPRKMLASGRRRMEQ